MENRQSLIVYSQSSKMWHSEMYSENELCFVKSLKHCFISVPPFCLVLFFKEYVLSTIIESAVSREGGAQS